MPNYIGEKCLECNSKFTHNDDIVVCPTCGTPYHRECYFKNNKCINEELHKSNSFWKSEKKLKMEIENRICRNCGYINPENVSSCQKCNFNLDDNEELNNIEELNSNEEFAIYNNLDEYIKKYYNEEFDKEHQITLSEISDYVKRNQGFYIPIFRRIKENKTKISFNILAYIFPTLYFANRKMYIFALISLGINFLLFLPVFILFITNKDILNNNGTIEEMLIFVSSIRKNNVVEFVENIGIFIKFGISLFANWLYYTSVIKNLKKIKSKHNEYEKYREEIKNVGGTSFGSVIIFIAASLFLPIFISYMYFFITALLTI